MRTLTFILLLLFTATVRAQLPAYPLQADSVAVVPLPHGYVQVLRDETGDLSFAEVLANPYQAQFRPAMETMGKKPYPGVYWLHYKLKNTAGTPVTIALTSAAVFATMYVRTNGLNWQKKQTGDFLSWHKKDGAKTISSIPYTLGPGGEMEVYQRDNFWQQNPLSIGVKIQYPQNMALQQYKNQNYEPHTFAQSNQLLSALISGILLFAAIIYIRFFFTVRSRFYLYYSLFLFGFSLMYSPLVVFLRGFPLVNFYVSYAAFVLGLFFFSQFFRSYLRTQANYRQWDKWLVVVSVLPLFFFVINYVVPGLLPAAFLNTTLAWGNRSFILVLDSLLVTAVLYIVTHKASAGIVATIPALLLWGLGQTYKLVTNLVQSGSATPSGLVRWINENNYLVDLISIVWIVSVFSSLLFQRFQHLQKKVLREAVKNERLKRQKEKERREMVARQKTELEQQVEERTSELKRANRELVTALRNLKEMQQQLIQSEKMASLGELTAGIAHEIQNPLNFINNFSEVGTELAQEIEEAVRQNNSDEAIAITKEMQESLQKIAHHGRRADSIVKGMLQHSRASAGAKELTNINTLADEYLRLSFHGLRAKDKNFTANFTTDFDERIGPIEVVPQDLGRVLLNLFNNAFYAVNQKKKSLNGTFEPSVSVTTKMLGEKIEIVVKDNGTGIPPNILDKIYQPFFTTKPTGEGTGLGLSLSYDIITKGHGGEMKVETKEGEGAVFKIFLPAATNSVNFEAENTNRL